METHPYCLDTVIAALPACNCKWQGTTHTVSLGLSLSSHNGMADQLQAVPPGLTCTRCNGMADQLQAVPPGLTCTQCNGMADQLQAVPPGSLAHSAMADQLQAVPPGSLAHSALPLWLQCSKHGDDGVVPGLAADVGAELVRRQGDDGSPRIPFQHLRNPILQFCGDLSQREVKKQTNLSIEYIPLCTNDTLELASCYSQLASGPVTCLIHTLEPFCATTNTAAAANSAAARISPLFLHVRMVDKSRSQITVV